MATRADGETGTAQLGVAQPETVLAAGRLLTDPVSGVSYLLPAGKRLRAGPLRLLDLSGRELRVSPEAAAPFRLDAQAAGEQLRLLEPRPDFAAALLRELGPPTPGGAATLAALLSADTPEAFAAALGASAQDGASLEGAQARLDALERGVAALGVERTTRLDALPELPGPARPPEETPALLALFGLLLAGARPAEMLPAPAEAVSIHLELPPLPDLSYESLLGALPDGEP